MPERHLAPFDHPAAWKASDFGAKDDFAVDLEDRHLRALVAEVDRLGDALPGHDEIDRKSFPLAAIQEDIRAWREEVWQGRGLLLLRGFPVADIPLPRLRLMYLGLGVHFGRPVSQSAMGDLVGDVVDVGGKDERERAYRGSRALNLHTDRCDHVAMLCIRPALAGGITGHASALAIHNTILAERPDAGEDGLAHFLADVIAQLLVELPGAAEVRPFVRCRARQANHERRESQGKPALHACLSRPVPASRRRPLADRGTDVGRGTRARRTP